MIIRCTLPPLAAPTLSPLQDRQCSADQSSRSPRLATCTQQGNSADLLLVGPGVVGSVVRLSSERPDLNLEPARSKPRCRRHVVSRWDRNTSSHMLVDHAAAGRETALGPRNPLEISPREPPPLGPLGIGASSSDYAFLGTPSSH